MTFTFKPAERGRIGLLIGLAGASGSGKTYSALLLAKGLANGSRRIGFIDTESGRGLHYADRFKFEHGELHPPFTPRAYSEAVLAGEEAGFDPLIIDSMSHEWAGEGGCSDMQAAEAERMATDRDGNLVPWKIEAMTAPAWKRPKIEHQRMMARMLQRRPHLIFCLRAQEKVKFVKGEKGRQEIVPIGFQPIQEKGFMFEMTMSLTFHPDTPGVIRYDLPNKINADLREIFREGELITEDMGIALREYAERGADHRPDPNEARVIEQARKIVEQLDDASPEDLAKMVADNQWQKVRTWFQQKRPEQSKDIEVALKAAEHRASMVKKGGGDPDDDFPGDRP